MAKYWVLFQKYAGVEVDADSEVEAIDKAEKTPESEYEYDQFLGNHWQLVSAEIID